MAKRQLADGKPVSSMTGFARQEGGDERFTWTWEIKSVNGKSLDLRFRLPPGYDALEGRARASAAQCCARGNLQVSLTMKAAAAAQSYRINRELLDRLLALSGELAAERGETAPVAPASLDGLLAVRGVVEVAEEEDEPDAKAAREAALAEDLERALAALAEARRAEGARPLQIVSGHLASLQALVDKAAASAAAQPEALRARQRAQVEELLTASPALPEERLAQEAAVLATKADIREELDRLVAHIEAARELLAGGGPVGRRLDFLCQELNREANTLCAKAADVDLSRIGLELKTVVDQLREQIQNLE